MNMGRRLSVSNSMMLNKGREGDTQSSRNALEGFRNKAEYRHTSVPVYPICTAQHTPLLTEKICASARALIFFGVCCGRRLLDEFTQSRSGRCH